MRILVAGGAGYIGSHTCVELLGSGHEVVVVDNLCNSSEKVIDRIEELTGMEVPFYNVDLLDSEALDEVFRVGSFDAVINFAGLKAVGESVSEPLRYYENNIGGALTLLKVMVAHGVKKLIFSSSATVYGESEEMPITEECPLGQITNPYGQTKAMIEQILNDVYVSDPEWRIVILRYFNPVGAHESGLIGEDPQGVPNNLVPFVAQVAAGKREFVGVFGDDYPTADGTGVRDYIHVVDLACGHVKAVEKLAGEVGACGDVVAGEAAGMDVDAGGVESGGGLFVYNLGTGRGSSVLDVIHAYERACGREIPYVIQGRRAGDIAECWCDASKAREELGWTAERTLDEMCEDSWRWQVRNPGGYGK